MINLPPLISRKLYMQKFVELSQSYRHRIEEAERERDMAIAKLDRFVEELAPRIQQQNTMEGIRILIEVDHRMLTASRSQHEVILYVRDNIMRRLMNLDKDIRGDLRQSDTQRMLGV